MIKLRAALIIFMMVFAVSCENENPIQPQQAPPILSDLAAADTILTGIDQSFIFSVKCIDENGIDDIDSVLFRILSNGGQLHVSGIMFDDGKYEVHGDIIPKDSIYSVRLKLDLNDGAYRFVVQAVDQARLRSNELTDTFFAVPGIINLAPVITKYNVSDTVFVDEIVPFYLSAQASDPDSQDSIQKVAYKIFEPSLTGIAEQGELNDQGINGDSLAGDGIYSIETTTAFASWKFGDYHLMIQAYDSHNKGSRSVEVTLPWAKMKIGDAPQILEVNAPKTIQLPSSGDESFLLTASVFDADDNRDVKEVFFNSFKPGNIPSDNNPFKMYDDGTSGDAIAGDFIFSLKIFIIPQNATGSYRFEFQAKDYSELSSEIIVRTIVVTN